MVAVWNDVEDGCVFRWTYRVICLNILRE